jgi:hypothetical protein
MASLVSAYKDLRKSRDEKTQQIEALHKQIEEDNEKMAEMRAELSEEDPIPCTHPNLVGRIINKTTNIAVDLYGRVEWDSEVGEFFISYEKGASEIMTVSDIRKYIVKVDHFYTKIDDNGCRSKRFARVLMFLSRGVFGKIRTAYDNIGITVQGNKFAQNLWPQLGQHEYEKRENAKKVLNYVYFNR